MATPNEINEWYEQWFGARRDANSQNALAALHAMLGTDKPLLEDKLTGGSLKKITETEGDA